MINIAVIGFSGRFPQANTTQEFWDNLCLGKECITFFTEAELLSQGISRELIHNPNYVKASPILSGIKLFDSEFFGFSPKEANLLDPQQRLLLECAWETLEYAGYASNYQAQKIGTFVGSGGVITTYLTELLMVNPDLLGLTGSLEHLANDKDFVPTHLSYKLNLTGPSLAVQTACSTSLLTVHLACQSIINDECDMALAGGVNVRIPHCTGYLRQRGDIYSSDGHIRTFDADASGIVFGSGVGLVLLKRLDQALKDGDTIHAVIKGSAVNNDGGDKLSYTASSFSGQVACIQKAFKQAKVDPGSLCYLEAHGTGTVMGDPIEVSALNHVFNQYTKDKKSCAIGSVKANVGHLDTAAGIVSLIKTIMMLKEKKNPPQINVNRLNPKIVFENGPFYVNTSLALFPSSSQPLKMGINSLGIGGTNVFMIVEEAPPKKDLLSSQCPLILNLSAKNKESLEKLVSEYQSYMSDKENVNFSSICYTSNVGRGQFPYRLSVMAESTIELKNNLASAEIVHSKERRVGIYLNKITQENLLRIQALLPSSQTNSVTIIANYLQLWMNLGVRPQVIFTSLPYLPSVAYQLGYIKEEEVKILKHNIEDLDEASLKKYLHEKCDFGNYHTEIILLPSYSNLLDYVKDENTKYTSSSCDLIISLSDDLDIEQEIVSILPGDEQNYKSFIGGILQELYMKGITINWQTWYEDSQRRIPLPTYPFKRRHHWISRRKLLHKQTSNSAWDTQKIHMPQMTDDVYQLILSRDEYPVLQDHYFYDKPMIAASVLISWLVDIAEKEYQIKNIAIENFQFLQALFLNDSHPQIMQCVITYENNLHLFKIRSYHEEGLIEEEKWIEHVQGTFNEKNPLSEIQIPVAELSVQLDEALLYQRFAERGLKLSSSYRCLQSVRKNEKEAFGILSLSHIHQEVYPQYYHPAILDALFQVVQTLIPEEYPPDLVFLLSQWGSLQIMRTGQSPRFIHATLKHLEDKKQLIADVRLLNDKHELLCSVQDVVIHSATKEIIHAHEKLHYQKWQYVFDWRELGSAWIVRDSFDGQIIIINDQFSLGKHVSDFFESKGNKTALLDSVEEIKDLLPRDGDLLFYPLSLNENIQLNSHILLEQLELICSPLMQAVQYFSDVEFSLIIVTQGAVSTGDMASHLNPLQMCLWGMGRTIGVELPRSTCHLIDLDPDESIIKQIPYFLEILNQFPDEGEIAIRKNRVYTSRLIHYSPRIQKKLSQEFIAQKYFITQEPSVKSPAQDEVFIRTEARGISYRDLLQINGMIDDSNPHIGDDFVGVVEQVGMSVKHLKPGDKVIGVNQGTLGSFIAVPAYCVVKLNSSLSIAQAAAWPLAYLTASYAFFKAPLNAGQWVFIMSAGSGVGFIAAQIAKGLGLNIIATVNGAEKEFLLKNLGVKYIVNTQEDNWQSRLSTILKEKSLDLIFSSTHPEITEYAFPYLGKKGRIIDLTAGRYDYSNTIRSHQCLIPIRMYDVIKQNPEWVQKSLTKCASYLQTKECTHIPIVSFSIDEIDQAFNQLQNPNHLNKIILTHKAPDEGLFKKQAMYLVVGGLGALGLHLIPWLFQEGADSICIVDRFDLKDDRLSTLRKNLTSTQQLYYRQCDITQLNDVQAMFASLAKLPPIKGIFNIATLLHDAPIKKQSWEIFKKIVEVKAIGSMNLHLCSLSLDCDYFVMFSSIASLMGSQNQLNYSAANAFQDSLACHRKQLGLPALAINWSPWQVGIGAVMGDHAVEVWKNWGSYRLDPGHDLESLRYLLTQDSPQVALLAIEWKKFLGQLVSIPGYLREIANEQSLSEEAASIEDNEFIIHLRNTPDENKKFVIGEFLREHVASSLQLLKEEIKLDQSFVSLGVDSLMAISLRDYIQKKLGYELPAMVIFTYPTINNLGEFILTQVIKIAPSEIPLEENNNEIIADNISAEDMDNLLDSLNEDNLHD